MPAVTRVERKVLGTARTAVYCVHMRAWLAAVLVVAACGGGGAGSGDDVQPDGPGSGSGDGSISGGSWTTLAQRTWMLGALAEDYKCRGMMTTQDMWIAGYRPIDPSGTHHMIVTLPPTAGPIGDYDCNAADVQSEKLLYGAGTGTTEFMFPTGVAMKLPAGTYVNLKMHVANFGDTPLSGTSGVEVYAVPASSVVNQADMLFLGNRNFMVAGDSQPHVIQGLCSAPADWHIFNLWPHMHQFGTHQKVVVQHANNSTETLIDTDYSVNEQRNYQMANIAIGTNETLLVDCTYVNTSGQTVQSGDGALAEMCVSGFYKYPAGGDIFTCWQ